LVTHLFDESVTSASGEHAAQVIASKTATLRMKPPVFYPDHALVLSHCEKQKYGQQRRGAKNEGCELDDHTMGRAILRSRAMRPGFARSF
jgi:hypothetical protein